MKNKSWHGLFISCLMYVIFIESASAQQISQGYSATGPMYFNPCSTSWSARCEIARENFNAMSYTTDEVVIWPSLEDLEAAFQDTSIAVYFLYAHGDETEMRLSCDDDSNSWNSLYSSDVEAWLTDIPKPRFTALMSCDGLCETGLGTMAYALTGGSTKNTAVLGLCTREQPECHQCQGYLSYWLRMFFGYLQQGKTIGESFNLIMSEYPQCEGCYRVHGDLGMRLVPTLTRINLCQGDFDSDWDVDGIDASTFKGDFGRSKIKYSCNNDFPCHGDFICDGDVDGIDAAVFKINFGRSSVSNPCPTCELPACSY